MKTIAGIAFLCLLVSFPASGQSNFEKGVQLFNDGKIAQSKALFLEAVKEDSHNAEAYYYLGLMSINGDYEAAIDYLEKAIGLAGTNAKYHFMLGNAYGSKAQHAGIFGKIGAASNCKEQYLTATSLDPRYTNARLNLIEYYLQAPGIMGGSVEKAAAEADTIKTYDPYAGFLAEARVHDYRKEKPQQLECCLKAISLDAKKPEAYRVLWLVYMNDNNETKADEVFKKAVAAVDNKSNPYFWAGLYFLQKNDFSKARTMFEEVIAKDPKNSPVYYQLGKVYLLSGADLDKGIGCLEKFLQLPQAKDAPGPEYAYWRIGMIYEKLGKIDSARAAYQKSLTLNPDLEEAKKALENLK